MRLKKQKHHRRSVRFFTTCYGFRPPFKVLCDGTFIHHLLINRITPADTAISNILGAPVKLFTTRCVREELRRLGKDFFESLNVARDLETARCAHEEIKNGVACLEDVIGEKNIEHFFVASQDADLRRQFQESSAVPVIFALRNALFLESPSKSQHEFAKASEEERSHMNESEIKMLVNKRKRSSKNKDPGDSAEADVKDKVQFNRKRAKGPNPLSCKKKKMEKQKPASKKEGDEIGETVRSRNKKRKRSRKQKVPVSATD